MSATPVPCTMMRPECKQQFEQHAAWLKGLQAKVERHGESIAAIKAQVALAAGFGSIVGGAIVSYFVRH